MPRSCSAIASASLAASSPTGPAFEGAEISCGQRAAPGAIERVRIDPETLEPRIRVIGIEAWSDEPKFEKAIKVKRVTGVCGSGIIEVIAEMYLAGIISEDGVIDGSLAAKSPRIVQNGRTWSYLLHDGDPRLMITQNDVRAIQLAKAALYAGIKLLMDKQGIDHVDRIGFAGAFGSFIDPKYAMVLGLIPDCDLDKVKAVGNAAGTGARMCLLNKDYRREIESHGAPHRKDRDGAGAEIPGAFRLRHGAAEQGRSVPETRRGRHAAAAQGRERGWPAKAAGGAADARDDGARPERKRPPRGRGGRNLQDHHGYQALGCLTLRR